MSFIFSLNTPLKGELVVMEYFCGDVLMSAFSQCSGQEEVACSHTHCVLVKVACVLQEAAPSW